jgi:hypothetical protein
MPDDRLDVILEVDDGAEERRLKLIGRGSWAERLRRIRRGNCITAGTTGRETLARDFIVRAGWGDAAVEALPEYVDAALCTAEARRPECDADGPAARCRDCILSP